MRTKLHSKDKHFFMQSQDKDGFTIKRFADKAPTLSRILCLLQNSFLEQRRQVRIEVYAMPTAVGLLGKQSAEKVKEWAREAQENRGTGKKKYWFKVGGGEVKLGELKRIPVESYRINIDICKLDAAVDWRNRGCFLGIFVEVGENTWDSRVLQVKVKIVVTKRKRSKPMKPMKNKRRCPRKKRLQVEFGNSAHVFGSSDIFLRIAHTIKEKGISQEDCKKGIELLRNEILAPREKSQQLQRCSLAQAVSRLPPRKPLFEDCPVFDNDLLDPVIQLKKHLCLSDLHVYKVARTPIGSVNRGLFDQLFAKEKKLYSQHTTSDGPPMIKHFAWHGTSADRILHILEQGFTRTRFGNGVYLSLESYGLDALHYSQPDPAGVRYMLLCEVLPGTVEVSTRGQTRPSTQNIHSGVDQLPGATMHVFYTSDMNVRISPKFLVCIHPRRT